jgi:hypothetical protein
MNIAGKTKGGASAVISLVKTRNPEINAIQTTPGQKSFIKGSEEL